MTIGFICNVGNRDLYVDGQPIDQDCRRRGQEILEDYNNYKGRLSAPIIEAGLGHILRQHGQKGLDWLALFVTDQDPLTTPPQHYARDTVTMGKVLKRYLLERYPHSKEQPGILKGRDKGVFCHHITGVNPMFFDEMHGFYERELAKPYFNPPDLERCYVSPVGGIPAANMALLLQAVARYGERCHALYVPEGSRQPVPMNITERILRDAKRRLAQEYIKNYHYAQAAGLMEGAGAQPWLGALARSAAHRFNLNYQAAWRELQERVLPFTVGEERNFVQGLCGELGQVAEGAALPAATAIRELYFSARIAYQSGRYMDFLHRVFSFLEGVLSYQVEAAFGIRVPGPPEIDSQEAFLKAVRANPYLVDFLAKAKYEGAPLRWEEGAKRPVLAAMLRYLAQYARGPVGGDYARLADLLPRLDSLAALRNRCVHPPFEGVSQERILEPYREEGGEEPLEDMGEIVRLLGLDAEDDAYRRVSNFIAARL